MPLRSMPLRVCRANYNRKRSTKNLRLFAITLFVRLSAYLFVCVCVAAVPGIISTERKRFGKEREAAAADVDDDDDIPPHFCCIRRNISVRMLVAAFRLNEFVCERTYTHKYVRTYHCFRFISIASCRRRLRFFFLCILSENVWQDK